MATRKQKFVVGLVTILLLILIPCLFIILLVGAKKTGKTPATTKVVEPPYKSWTDVTNLLKAQGSLKCGNVTIEEAEDKNLYRVTDTVRRLITAEKMKSNGNWSYVNSKFIFDCKYLLTLKVDLKNSTGGGFNTEALIYNVEKGEFKKIANFYVTSQSGEYVYLFESTKEGIPQVRKLNSDLTVERLDPFFFDKKRLYLDYVPTSLGGINPIPVYVADTGELYFKAGLSAEEIKGEVYYYANGKVEKYVR